MKFDHDDYVVMGSRLKYRTLKPEDMHRISPDHHIHPKLKEFLKIDNPLKGALGIDIYDLINFNFYSNNYLLKSFC